MNAMREVTASEASRNFSALLDSVEHGETVVVTRGGRRIAAITPAPAANGGALNEVITRWRGSEALDDMFSENIADARAAASSEKDANPWSD
jgi:prevent-host-death family protein